MEIRLNLRLRVIIAFVLLTLFISSAFALSIRYAFLVTEEDLFNNYLRTEVEDFLEFYKHDKTIITRPRTSFTLYVDTPGKSGYIPENIKHLTRGLHEVYVDDNEYHVFVREPGEEKLYFVFDLTEFEEHEEFINIALLIGIFLSVSAAVWLGYFTGNRVISPVTRLADQVSKMQDAELALFNTDTYANDEVGILAHEFRIYISRLQAFLERERNFTADVSHELRTPLTIISGAAEVMLANPGLDEKSVNKLTQIHRASNEMAEIITAFLLLAREPGKNNDENNEVCLLNSIVQEQINQHKYLLNNKPVEISLIENTKTYINAEAKMISIVAGNIIRNAYTHTDKGDIKVTVSEKLLVVEDSGPGIDKELRDKVFERSFQVNPGKTGGTGIGLSIAKRLCDRHQWSIKLDAREGGGTRVELDFS